MNILKQWIGVLSLCSGAFIVQAVKAEETKAYKGFAWPSVIPTNCPFKPSASLTGIHFTGRQSDYHCGDTFYPTWASDGNLYSPWTDGMTDGVKCTSGGGMPNGFRTGQAVMIGDDPLNLQIKNISDPKQAIPTPYRGRYPAGSLVYNGIWYYGTYCLGPSATFNHQGFGWNWPNLGPVPGFHISRDLGKTWEEPAGTPVNPLFPEPAEFLGPVKMGAPHFVDFGKNMEHSPDGKAYVLAMGAEINDPLPRPCLKKAADGKGLVVNDTCEERMHVSMRQGEAKKEEWRKICEPAFKQIEGKPFAHANLSWITADQIYLARVTPSPATINDIKAWEFFAGHDPSGRPLWTDDFSKIKPLLEWNNHMGCVTATWVPGLKKYLMCVTDGWPTVTKMTSYILEADAITGPWRMVSYMKDFGEQGYFLNFPSKFISKDGRTLWLCYSANFTTNAGPSDTGVAPKINPPGGRYGLSLHEVKLVGVSSGDGQDATKPVLLQAEPKDEKGVKVPQAYDVAAYVWPSYTGDEPRSRIFWPDGEGEWQTVKTATSKFKGHNWPRKPLWGYVNEADPLVMEKQIDAAADHGVNVFIYDWYWYDDRPFLEQCLNNGYLKARNNSRVKFYLMWANHDAGYTWDKRLAHVDQKTHVWKGSVDRTQFEVIAHRLIKNYFKHPSYYTIDGCPVFQIYDLKSLVSGLGGIEQTTDALKWFRAQVTAAGLPGLHLQLTSWGANRRNMSGVDGGAATTLTEEVKRLGFDSMTNYQYCHFTNIDRDYGEIMKDVQKEWARMDKDFSVPYFPHVSVGWDNNPRFQTFRPGVVKNNTPEAIEKAFRMARDYADAHPKQPRLITINSWNEWTETSYLQPDDLYGYGYLEAAKKVFVDRQ